MKYTFKDLIDIPKLQSLLDSFSNATGVATSIVDADGSILVSSGQSKVCSEFHQLNSLVQKNCIAGTPPLSDYYSDKKKYFIYKCENCFNVISVPVIIEGCHTATIYEKNFFFTEPDLEKYREQAKTLGFEEDKYIAVIKEIPIIGQNEVRGTVKFLTQLAEMLAELGYERLKHLETIVSLGIDITERKDMELKLKKSYEEMALLNIKLAASSEQLKQQYAELQRQQEALKLSEERYRFAVDGANDITADWDTVNGILYLSGKWMEITGYEEIVIARPLEMAKWVIHPDDFTCLSENIQNLLIGKTASCSFEFRIRIKDGEYKWLHCRGIAQFDSNGKAVRIAGSMSDISKRKEAEEKIQFLAYVDSITGLPNRTYFVDKLADILDSYKPHHRIGAVLFIDVDDFKKINDTHGHLIGDELLKNIGEKLKSCFDEDTIIARLGGDEFTILLTDLKNHEEVGKCAQKVMKAFEIPWVIKGHEFYITASIGISIFPDDGNNMSDLLRSADTAMYSAKAGGKNTYRFYEKIMNLSVLKRLELEKDLKHGIENEQFSVYYQPQIDVKTNEIIGMEALLRWIHPEKGVVLPMEFIPLAEETGMIIPIGEWILRQACRQNKNWQELGYNPFSISVNVSAVQLQNTGFVESVIKILDETGLSPEYLDLEITESILMTSLDKVTDTLGQLKKIGVRISLDDFGKGYSSLSYLRRLPIDNLKIDQTFVSDLEVQSTEDSIIAEIIAIAHKMKMQVTAEGVELEEQLNILRELMCDKAQGYLFSKPLPACEVLARLQ